MKKMITQVKQRKEKEVVAPSEKTLDFLKQFARVYHVEKSLPKEISGLCTN
ncbi:MAG: hypothetical protein LBV43_15275 [Prevotella sp.]|jgi:DNA-directed RNA polymerase subunit F|nr:hypothetical protein [Prevotella sp.]